MPKLHSTREEYLFPGNQVSEEEMEFFFDDEFSPSDVIGLEVDPELEQYVDLLPEEIITEAYVTGRGDCEQLWVSIFDRSNMRMSCVPVECTRLQRVKWGLQEDPYGDSVSEYEWKETLKKLDKMKKDALEYAYRVCQEQYGEEFEK